MFAAGQEEDAAAADVVPEGIDRKPLRLPGLEAEADAVSDGESPRVRWVQQGRTGTRFYNTPLSFAEDLNRLRREKGEAWVFTSATLSVAGDFSHFLTEIGLPDAKTASWPSPFDYFSLASLYLPKDSRNRILRRSRSLSHGAPGPLSKRRAAALSSSARVSARGHHCGHGEAARE